MRSLWVLFPSLALAPALRAQIPLLPVLQSPFVAPGIGVGINAGGSGSAGFLGGAASWAPPSTSWQLNAGAGTTFASSSRMLQYGARIAVPLPLLARGGAWGAAAFAGIGGTSASGDTTALDVPIGAAIGWRAGLSGSRSIAVSLAPFLLIERTLVRDAPSTTYGEFRVSAGVELAMSPRLGVIVGAEIGGRRHGLFGAGLSYQLRSHSE